MHLLLVQTLTSKVETRVDASIDGDGGVQDGGVTLGGSLYGRVYSIPVPRGRSSLDGSLWEPSPASSGSSVTGECPEHRVVP